MNEIWKDIKGYEGLYQVSSRGRIKSLCFNHTDYSKIMKKGSNTSYDKIILTHNYKQKTFLIHRLVAETFIPNPFGFKCVNHKDGNKMNNNVENLEWCTYSHNLRHAYTKNLRKARTKKVEQYDLKGNLIKIWDSLKEASLFVEGNSTGIHQCCSMKHPKKTYKGYVWKYHS